MAIMMIMEWEGVTPEQYEAVRKEANWEGNRPKGGNLHLASFALDRRQSRLRFPNRSFVTVADRQRHGESCQEGILRILALVRDGPA